MIKFNSSVNRSSSCRWRLKRLFSKWCDNPNIYNSNSLVSKRQPTRESGTWRKRIIVFNSKSV